ncbi:unnamed protein product [Echinostoma caproni]|uniref:Uncharacterized protein n=1 Tax=Echinostoma caproni TaxID=27848 RepID=A0A183A2E0_9TREM|nr:unnamed protein product [Echinostoma caproni]
MSVKLPQSKEPESQTRINYDINLLRETLERLFIPGEETSAKHHPYKVSVPPWETRKRLCWLYASAQGGPRIGR